MRYQRMYTSEALIDILEVAATRIIGTESYQVGSFMQKSSPINVVKRPMLLIPTGRSATNIPAIDGQMISLLSGQVQECFGRNGGGLKVLAKERISVDQIILQIIRPDPTRSG